MNLIILFPKLKSRPRPPKLSRYDKDLLIGLLVGALSILGYLALLRHLWRVQRAENEQIERLGKEISTLVDISREGDPGFAHRALAELEGKLGAPVEVLVGDPRAPQLGVWMNLHERIEQVRDIAATLSPQDRQILDWN